MKSRAFYFILVRSPKEPTAKDEIIRSTEGTVATLLLAKDEQEARMKAARLIPTHLRHTDVDLEEIEILLRPY